MFAIFSLRRPDILPVGTYHNEVPEVVNQCLMSQATSAYNGVSFVGCYHSTSQSTESSYHQRKSKAPPRTHERSKTNSSQTWCRNLPSPGKMPRPRAVSLALTRSRTRTRKSKGKTMSFLALGSLTRLRPAQLGVWIKLQSQLPKTRHLSSLSSLQPSQTC